MEFEKFSKIENLKKLSMSITQKLHGTNAQVYIVEILSSTGFNPDPPNAELDGRKYVIKAGSRNRWVHPDDDHYGFATFVEANKEAFIKLLGSGRHYGEWAGPGINSGEGLPEKTFFLFNWQRWQGEELPPQVSTVPVLYDGELNMDKITEVSDKLKAEGSRLAPGFMRPEGIVVSLAGKFYKKPFDPEETQWTKAKSSNKGKNPKTYIDYSHLLQPIRLEKIISSDERYTREYPKSLPQIVAHYVKDLIEEGQISGDEDKIKAVKKGSSTQIFRFIRSYITEKGI